MVVQRAMPEDDEGVQLNRNRGSNKCITDQSPLQSVKRLSKVKRKLNGTSPSFLGGRLRSRLRAGEPSLPKIINLRLTDSTTFRAVEEDSEKSLVRRPIRHVGELRLGGEEGLHIGA